MMLLSSNSFAGFSIEIALSMLPSFKPFASSFVLCIIRKLAKLSTVVFVMLLAPSHAKTYIVCIGSSNLPLHVFHRLSLHLILARFHFEQCTCLLTAKTCLSLARLNMVVSVRLCAPSCATTCITFWGHSHMHSTFSIASTDISCSLNIYLAQRTRSTQLRSRLVLTRLNMVVSVRLLAFSCATNCIIWQGRSNMPCTVYLCLNCHFLLVRF